MPTNDSSNDQLVAALVGMAVVTTAAVAYSVRIHIKEAKKRKLIRQSVMALDEMKQTDAYRNASPEERQQMIHDLVDRTLLVNAPK